MTCLVWLVPAWLAAVPHAPPKVLPAYRTAASPAEARAAATATAPACSGGCLELSWVQKADVINDTGDPGRGVEGAAAGLIGGKIYVAHGLSDADGKTLRIYDIASDSWSLGPEAHFPRSEGSGLALGTRLYSIGGRFGSATAVLEIFDTTTQSWTVGPSMQVARAGLGLAELGGKIHAVGGRATPAPMSGSPLDAHEVFDPATSTWSARAPLLVPVADCYATAALGNRLYVFGGFDGSRSVAFTQVYDPDTDTWSFGAPMPTPRSNAVAGVLGSRLAVIAGSDGANLAVVEVYDPASDAWCSGPEKPRPASELASAGVSTGSAIYTIGSGALGMARNYHEALVLGGGGSTDHEPPVLLCPDNLDLECPAETAPIEAWRNSATATDNCSPGPLTVAGELIAHAPACGDTYVDTYEFRATDPALNTSTCQRTVTVLDTAPPEITTLPQDEVAACNAVPAAVSPMATDACGPSPSLALSESRTSPLCPDSYTLNRTWTATDACGNHQSRTQVITVRDSQAPELPGAPGDTAAECDDLPAAPALTPSDGCDPSPSLGFQQLRNHGPCTGRYELVRQWTVADRCGNTRIHTQRVAVTDTTPPRLQTPPPLALECNAAGGVPQSDPRVRAWLGAATASDTCSAASVSHQAPPLFPSGCAPGETTAVGFVARDECGNRAASSAVLSVLDTTPPVLSACALIAPPAGLPPLASRPARPASSAPCPASRQLRIDCGVAADHCDTQPVTRTAELTVGWHELSGGACTEVSERVPVECDEVVVLRLLPPPCPARPMAPQPAVSVVSGQKWISGERLTLSVTAADGCGNVSLPCTSVPPPCAPRPAACPRSACAF